MTDQEMRIAIAECLGWQHCTVNHGSTGMFLKGIPIGTDPKTERTAHIPNYPEDLNACAEFERTLSDDEYWPNYYDALAKSTGDDYNMRNMVSATARQRCEAFLRVKGLWK